MEVQVVRAMHSGQSVEDDSGVPIVHEPRAVAPAHKCPKCSGIDKCSIGWEHLDHPGKRSMVRSMMKLGVLTKSLKASHVKSAEHRQWLHEDEDYAAAFENAKHNVGLLLEDAAVDRALNGTRAPVIYQGSITGEYVTHDNKLLMSMLKVKGGEEFRQSRSSRSTTNNVTMIDARTIILDAVRGARLAKQELLSHEKETSQAQVGHADYLADRQAD